MALDRQGDMAYDGISDHANVALSTIRSSGYMTKLQVMGLVRVVKWIRPDCGGSCRPVFSTSPGKDARRPTPLTDAQRGRRWKKKVDYYTSYAAEKQANESLCALLKIQGALK